MSDFDQNIPDDFWRRAFDEAAETPPPRVWDAVEHRLNEDNGPKILPLWGAGSASSRSLLWGMGVAATIALLLMGWWLKRPVAPGSQMAVQQTPGQASTGRESASVATDRLPSPNRMPVRPSTPGKQAGETVAANQKATSPGQDSRAAFGRGEERLTDELATRPVSARTDALAEAVGAQQPADGQPVRSMQRTIASAGIPRATNQLSLLSTDAATLPPPPTNLVLPGSEPASTSTLPMSAGQTLFFEPIRSSALRLREPGSIRRIVWLRPAEPSAGPAIQSARKEREVWASVSMMPGAFNPAVTVQSMQSVPNSFADASTLNSGYANQPSVSSRANFSVAYQAGAGIQLTERWSVESGVGYLAGHSTVVSPVQTAALNSQSADVTNSGQQANLYVDALRTSSLRSAGNALINNSMAGFSNLPVNSRYAVQNSYNPQTRQVLTNNYQFVQVPIQVGFQLRPRKRLSLALLGGLLSNIFVRNTVGDNLVITTRDGVYRPVSWAATLGARFRYRPSRQWSASLAGVYQPSLGPGTRPESAVQTRPTSTGLSFGVDYHF